MEPSHGKHGLTPSKVQREPGLKHQRQEGAQVLMSNDEEGGQSMLTAPSNKEVRQKLSGRFCKERHSRFSELLRETFFECPGHSVQPKEVLVLLGLGETKEDKRVATKVMSDTFPSFYLNRTKKEYRNVKRKYSFSFESTEGLQFQSKSAIEKLIQNIKTTSDAIESCRNELYDALQQKKPRHSFYTSFIFSL